MITWTRWTSFALRTNDSAMRSAPARRPQRRSASSFSDSAGTLTATPGRLMPLLFETGAADDHLGGHDGAVGLDDLDAHLAVVDQQEVARP